MNFEAGLLLQNLPQKYEPLKLPTFLDLKHAEVEERRPVVAAVIKPEFKGAASLLELAESINELTGNPTPMDFTPAREWDRSGKRFGATERAKATIGFECDIELHKGLVSTIEWTRANMAFIDTFIAIHAPHMSSAT